MSIKRTGYRLWTGMIMMVPLAISRDAPIQGAVALQSFPQGEWSTCTSCRGSCRLLEEEEFCHCIWKVDAQQGICAIDDLLWVIGINDLQSHQRGLSHHLATQAVLPSKAGITRASCRILLGCSKKVHQWAYHIPSCCCNQH